MTARDAPSKRTPQKENQKKRIPQKEKGPTFVGPVGGGD
jgi:hypothetical protein